MSNSVIFKYGSTLEGKSPEENELVLINNGLATGGDERFGSIYKGSKIVGTTEADNLYTTEAIQIAGGPLADKMSEVFGDEIPAGTSLHDFIKLLACTDTYPSTASLEGTFSTTIPGLNISGSKTNNAVVEIGSTVDVNKINAQATKVNTTDAEVSGLTYGYKTSLDGNVNTGNSISKSWVTTVNADDVYSLTAVANGFSGLTNASAENASARDCYLDTQTLTVGLGTNTLSVSETGVGYTGSIDSIDSVYIVSNIGSTSEDHKTEAIAAQTNVESTPTRITATYSLTGVYPIFNNINGDTLQNEVTNKMSISNSKVFTIDYPAEGDERVAFAYPSGRTITKVENYIEAFNS